jgi:hypothetical protein
MKIKLFVLQNEIDQSFKNAIGKLSIFEKHDEVDGKNYFFFI